MRRVLPFFTLVSLAALLVVELGTTYDTAQRQVALAITNVGSLALFLAVRRLLKRRGLDLPWSVLVFIAAGVWLDALGNFQHLYARFWWWDRLTHVVGLLPVTWGVLVVLGQLEAGGRIRLHPAGRALFAVGTANLLGAVYEISEWLGDIWFGTERVRGPFDAPHDLANNLIGSVLVVLAAWATGVLTSRAPSASVPPQLPETSGETDSTVQKPGADG